MIFAQEQAFLKREGNNYTADRGVCRSGGHRGAKRIDNVEAASCSLNYYPWGSHCWKRSSRPKATVTSARGSRPTRVGRSAG